MRIRSLVFLVACGVFLFPVLSSAQEVWGPITEIEQPGHQHAVIFEPKHVEKPSPSIPLPPIIKKPDKTSGDFTEISSPVGSKLISSGEVIGGATVPIGNMSAATSQTERLLNMIEGAIKKLK